MKIMKLRPDKSQKFKSFILCIKLIIKGREVNSVIIIMNNIASTRSDWYPQVVILINRISVDIIVFIVP